MKVKVNVDWNTNVIVKMEVKEVMASNLRGGICYIIWVSLDSSPDSTTKAQLSVCYRRWIDLTALSRSAHGAWNATELSRVDCLVLRVDANLTPRTALGMCTRKGVQTQPVLALDNRSSILA